VSFGSDHPLVYPSIVTIGALAVFLALAPFADLDQVSALAVLALVVLGYTGFQVALALGYLPNGLAGSIGAPSVAHSVERTDTSRTGEAPRTVTIKRVRQQHRLVSRSWLEITYAGRTRWLPVFFTPALLRLTETTADIAGRSLHTEHIRFYPSGRIRSTEPPGRLIDNPSLPDPDAPSRYGFARRLHLDAQSTVAAPFAGLMWVYVAGGGLGAFVGAICVTAAAALWLSAIRGSDPS
jgi:hypothetical protein